LKEGIPNIFRPFYLLLQNVSLLCTPGKATGVKALKLVSRGLDTVLRPLESMAKNDPTAFSQILHLLAKDGKETTTDTIKLLNNWGTFIPLLNKLQLLAHEELITPLYSDLPEVHNSINESHVASRFQTAEYSVSDGSWFGALKARASDVVTVTTNVAKHTGNAALVAKNYIDHGVAAVTPVTTSLALQAASIYLKGKVKGVERDTKQMVVKKVTDVAVQKILVLAILYCFKRLFEMLPSSDSDLNIGKYAGQIFLPMILAIYVVNLYSWKNARMRSDKEVAREVVDGVVQNSNVKLAASVAGVIQSQVRIKDEYVQSFTTKAVKLIEQHVAENQT
jgi:hypothetical protein